MPQTSRELVTRCLQWEYPERIPRDLWVLPWAANRFPETVAEINRRFPTDFVTTEYFYPASARVHGDPYQIGRYTDEWGCVFVNYQNGVIGEVKEPLVTDIRDWRKVQPPYEQLPHHPEAAKKIINEYYAHTDKFVFANCCPRPWERYQFLRGSENALVDVMMPEEGGRDLLQLIHEFYLQELEFWIKMDVDAIRFMDDWGAQHQLLIPPRIWRELFKPLYKDYCDLAHAGGKFAFMHSDGHIAEIFEDLIEIGVDAINSQLFCMNFKELEQKAKGKITLWGEIDRQHVLPSANPEDGRAAVRKVAQHFYDPRGGVIAQFEFGAGANPATAMAIFDEWEKIGQKVPIPLFDDRR